MAGVAAWRSLVDDEVSVGLDDRRELALGPVGVGGPVRHVRAGVVKNEIAITLHNRLIRNAQAPTAVHVVADSVGSAGPVRPTEVGSSVRGVAEDEVGVVLKVRRVPAICGDQRVVVG